jgi:sugar phosphate isomerase/epimerase
MAMTATGQGTGSSATLTDLCATLDRLERAGIEVAELMPDRYWVLLGGTVNEARLSLLERALADRPLRYTVHAPFGLNLFDLRHPGLQEVLFRACIRVTAALGAEVLVYHSGRREAGGTGGCDLEALLEIERTTLRAMGEFAAERGVLIAVENMTPTAERKTGLADSVPYGADLRALARQIAAVDHPSVGICLDFGHAHLFEASTGGDLVDAVAAAAPLVNHLHVHDNFGRPDEHPWYTAHADLRAIGESDLHLPIGWGSIPFRQIANQVAFPRSPISLSEVSTIDDEVLAETVTALAELNALNAAAARGVETAV